MVDGDLTHESSGFHNRQTKGEKQPMGDQPAATDVDVFVGVDMAKEDHYAHAIGPDSNELFARTVRNDQADIEAAIDTASEAGKPVLVIDMTASSAHLLLATAAARGMPVAYVTGLQMRRAADLYAGSAKTDPRDAFILADYARRHVDRLTWLDIDDELLVRLRVLNGRDVDLAGDATRTINRCRDALVAISPALERVVGPKLTHSGVQDLMGRWATPTALRTAGKTRVRTLIAKRSPRLADKLTDQIWDALDAQTLTLPAEDTWGEVIADLAGDLTKISSRRDALKGDIEEAFLAHPLGKVLVTLCGFGPRTGARTLAEIGDPHRFATGGHLASYAALAPVNRQSGRTLDTATRQRRGNHRLKNALFLAAFVATQHDPDARAYYQRKRAEGKKHNAAVICVARRRCDLILAMLKNREPYRQPQPENLPQAA